MREIPDQRAHQRRMLAGQLGLVELGERERAIAGSSQRRMHRGCPHVAVQLRSTQLGGRQAREWTVAARALQDEVGRGASGFEQLGPSRPPAAAAAGTAGERRLDDSAGRRQDRGIADADAGWRRPCAERPVRPLPPRGSARVRIVEHGDRRAPRGPATSAPAPRRAAAARETRAAATAGKGSWCADRGRRWSGADLPSCRSPVSQLTSGTRSRSGLDGDRWRDRAAA